MDNVNVVILALISLLVVMMGVVVLMGRGDWMISGYNTAPPETRQQYNLPRLRLVTGLGTIIVMLSWDLLVILDLYDVSAYVLFGEAVVMVVISKTWAKRGF